MQSLIAESLWQRSDLILAAVALLPVGLIVGYFVWHWRKAELEAELRRELLARGISAEEVERVLRAPSQKTDD